MTIYALKGNSEWCEIHESLREGIGRFGYSYDQGSDLRVLRERIAKDGWETLSEAQMDCYQNFLLEFKADDYVVYINVPEWGKCTIAKVTGEYYWDYKDDDFNHRFPVDRNSVFVFDRNDASVHPALSARLKLQGRWWRIYLEKEFSELRSVLEMGLAPVQRTPQTNLKFLAKEIQPFLNSITSSIHHTHPNYDLECLFSQVFKKVPGVIDVKWQGGAGDHGADILVTFEGGLPISGLEKQSVLVVQVKSYEGEHWDSQAVEDIKRAFASYPEASMGLIISTANSFSATVEQALDKLREETEKPISILVGADVAAMVLKYGAELIS